MARFPPAGAVAGWPDREDNEVRARQAASVPVNEQRCRAGKPARVVRKSPVSLSDEERRSLEELEQDLAATDPDLAHELMSGRLRGAKARTTFGVLAVLCGFVMVIAGIITQLLVLGVVGFLLAGSGAYLLFAGTPFRRRVGRYGQGPAA